MSRADTYGNGRIFLRGQTWWLDYSLHGRRVRESAGTTRRVDALKCLRARLGAKEAGQSVPGRVTFAELEQRLRAAYDREGRRSTKRLGYALTHLRSAFGAAKAAAITTDRLEQYVADRRLEGAAFATIKYELAVFRRAFNLAARAKVLGAVPVFPSILVDNARKEFFSPAEFHGLVASLVAKSADLADVVTFAHCTGWRIPSEVLTLQWDQVDFLEGVVILRTSKNRAGRTFPFDAVPNLRLLLERRRAWTETLERMDGASISHVFHRRGVPITDYRAAWAAACKAAKVGRKVPHDLRRTAVRNLVRAGVSVSVAMKLTGHKTDAVFRRYDIVDEQDLKAAGTQLASYLAERAPS